MLLARDLDAKKRLAAFGLSCLEFEQGRL